MSACHKSDLSLSSYLEVISCWTAFESVAPISVWTAYEMAWDKELCIFDS